MLHRDWGEGKLLEGKGQSPVRGIDVVPLWRPVGAHGLDVKHREQPVDLR
jgi:hypothetical protein